MKKIFLFLIVIFNFNNTFSFEIKKEGIDNVKKYLDSLKLNEKEYFSVIVSQGDQTLFKYNNSENKVKPNSKYPLASLSKQFTAFIIYSLINENKLKEEDLISKYLSNTPELFKSIKIKHLLNHSSGIPDFDVLLFIQGKISSNDATILEILYKTEKLNFVSGETYSYSNSNYFLLAKIIENITSQDYNKNLEKYIFQKYLNNDYIYYQDSDIKINFDEFNLLFDIENKDILKTSNYKGSSSIFLSLEVFNKWQNIVINEITNKNEIFLNFVNLDTLNNGKPITDTGGFICLSMLGDTLLHFGGVFEKLSNYSYTLVGSKINVSLFSTITSLPSKIIVNDIIILLYGKDVKSNINLKVDKYLETEIHNFLPYEGIYKVQDKMNLAFYFVKNLDGTFTPYIFQSWDFEKYPIKYINDSTFSNDVAIFNFIKNTNNNFDIKVIQNNQIVTCNKDNNITFKIMEDKYKCNVLNDEFILKNQNKFNESNLIMKNNKEEIFYQVDKDKYMSLAFILLFDENMDFTLQHSRVHSLKFIKE